MSFVESAFPTSYFPPNLPTTLDFAALGIQLEAGTTYHIVFRTDSAVFHDYRYALHALNSHAGSFGLPYLYSPDGTATWQSGSYSLEVPLQVAIIPEPASTSAFCLGLALWVTRGRVCRSHRRGVHFAR